MKRRREWQWLDLVADVDPVDCIFCAGGVVVVDDVAYTVSTDPWDSVSLACAAEGWEPA